MRIFILATTALVISNAFGPMSPAGESESSFITIRATPDGISIESTDSLTETAPGCDKSGKCGDRFGCEGSCECDESCVCEKKCAFGQGCECGENGECGENCERNENCECDDARACRAQLTCRGLKCQLPPGLPERPIAIVQPFQPSPFVPSFQVWPSKRQRVAHAKDTGPTDVRDYLPLPQTCGANPFRPVVSATAVASQSTTVQMPEIPESLTPENGSVLEYWPNGEAKSEREYRKGRVISAIYYASDGTVVYEMESDQP